MSGDDASFMRRAIALAATNLGLTGDNPSVGCVIVRGGQVVGEGVTAAGGRPHAEELALRQAGEAARGATAYVTLEPCAQRSSGGASCSELLAAAGLARVVAALADHSTFAGGHGAERLRAQGTVFDLGLLEGEAAPLYAAYNPATGDPRKR
ncbi:bifunctional diaminohydroxyphosphoribosylaminopyrimidine deaminase/5-amino-6-(5-phosphoribosylamino)uracil reductase RibD [Phenylobacterium sp.]|uniref:bifunctional diaminohydroxyphosphoribosylaminopyrimidine deaminase/5-amino-6-(5-phosphoribosylamino)uracil reductase RibD n=1 Tax=Phenylobacterium sp. TaxID=1871053 RepID=UPI003983926E